jgi:glycerophosphoryl diester phosphodiesterase
MLGYRDTFKDRTLKWILSQTSRIQTPEGTGSSGLILGHRGFQQHAPENTIQACLDALAAGAHGVEIDVKCSLDGVPVVFHDKTLKRLVGRQGEVARLSLSQLQAVSLLGGTSKWSDTISTLEEFLHHMPMGATVNIEIKDFPERYHRFEQKVIELMSEHQHRLSYIISSFDLRSLFKMRQLGVQFPLGLLLASDQIWFLKYGLAIPFLKPEAVHPHFSMVDQELVNIVHERGMRIHVWTVNDVDRAERLLEMGVDALITDNTLQMTENALMS